MSTVSEDPIDRGLAQLAPVPIDAAVADAVRRSARIELIEAGNAGPAWPAALLQGLLLASGAAYTWGYLLMMARLFGGA